jgi:hypothetical protein
MDGPVQDRMLRRRDSYSEAPYKEALYKEAPYKEAPYKRNSDTATDRYHRGMANHHIKRALADLPKSGPMRRDRVSEAALIRPKYSQSNRV